VRSNVAIGSMEPVHVSEGDLASDIRSILTRVETGGEVIIERDAQPVAVIRPAGPVAPQDLLVHRADARLDGCRSH
jgi:antitoxin (DNA-binding transcriptional repressor) of toxin-antitoxin stability system